MSEITNDEIVKFKEVAQAATQKQWFVGSYQCSDIDDAVRWSGDMLRHRPEALELFMVYSLDEWTADVGLDAVCPAFTGNGPTSEANAQFIALANPSNVIALLDTIVHLRSRLARYARLERAAQNYFQLYDLINNSGGIEFVDMPNPIYGARKELRDALAALKENKEKTK